MIILTALLAIALWQKARDRSTYLLDPSASPPARVSVSDGLIAALMFFVLQALIAGVVVVAGRTGRAAHRHHGVDRLLQRRRRDLCSDAARLLAGAHRPACRASSAPACGGRCLGRRRRCRGGARRRRLHRDRRCRSTCFRRCDAPAQPADPRASLLAGSRGDRRRADVRGIHLPRPDLRRAAALLRSRGGDARERRHLRHRASAGLGHSGVRPRRSARRWSTSAPACSPRR